MTWGAPTRPPTSPNARNAPAKPWRSSITMRDTLSGVGSLLSVTASQVARVIMVAGHASVISVRVRTRRPSNTLTKGENERP